MAENKEILWDMNNPITKKLREKMAQDPFYRQCCLKSENCFGRIEWHHHFSYGGRNLNEPFGILPLCVFHHFAEKSYTKPLNEITKSRMTEEDFKHYPKKQW